MKSKILGLVATTLICGNVFAGSVEKWEGVGAAYSPDGKQISTYQISVTNIELANHVIQSEATVTRLDGSQKIIAQKITVNGNNWSVESNLGIGSGACYGGDICENYISGENGLAYATTIISDSADNRRNVTMKLQNGKAVEVLRDNLTRIQ